MSAAVPEEQADQFEADHDDCVNRVQPDEPPPPMNSEQADAYFDRLLDVAACVRALGYQVEEPPSRQAAVEALQQEVINLGWDPYEHPTRTVGSREELNEVYRECPQPTRPSS